jgi:signal peptidase I
MAAILAGKKQASFLLRYALQSLFIILLLGLAARWLVVSSYTMSGVGMLPSVWPGDFVLAIKTELSQVKRGTVVTLRCPGDRDKICMKRVVGVGGDRLEFHGGRLYINGKSAFERALGANFAQETSGGRHWAVWPSEGAEGDRAPIVVPPKSVYLLNDKRSDREDSRVWGVVATDQLEARVKWIWLSLEWFDGEQIRTWPKLRWERMLRSID